jgi:hypothetical protein
MLQVSIVHAEADAARARQIGSYLERNCLIALDYDWRVTAGQPILDAIGRALSSDVVVVLVSPHSVPQRLDRQQWEPLFVGEAHERRTRIAYVPLADCPFPKVLLRGNSFDEPRALKHWIFELHRATDRPDFIPARPLAAVPDEQLDALARALADQPGAATVASGE